jgi:DNA-binding sugar fermentation-stimulating protein
MGNDRDARVSCWYKYRIPNKLVKIVINTGKVPELTGFDVIKHKVRYGENSRVDLLMEKNQCKCYVEIKISININFLFDYDFYESQ